MAANVTKDFCLLYVNNINILYDCKFREGLNNRITICYQDNKTLPGELKVFYRRMFGPYNNSLKKQLILTELCGKELHQPQTRNNVTVFLQLHKQKRI